MADFIRHVLGTKGVLHSFERSAQIITRYSFGRRRFADMMRCLEDYFAEKEMRVTFCITASLLGDHIGFFRRFGRLGHEFAAHGFFHTDMKKKSSSEQSELINRSYDAFRENGLVVTGFRCPYLSYNNHTVKALNDSRFTWVSNDIIFWDEACAKDNDGIKKLDLLYRKLDSRTSLSVPRLIGNVVDIPITAPDDEMVYERYRVKDPGEIERIWSRILRKTYERGELFHLLFHPERFSYVKEPLKTVFHSIKPMDPPVWFATLNDIANWWEKRSEADWQLLRLSSGLYRYKLEGPPGSTLLMKTNYSGPSLYKNYKTAQGTYSGDGTFEFTTPVPEPYRITLTTRTHHACEEFLRAEGFIVERGERAEGGLVLDHEQFTDKDRLKVLDEIDGSKYPLLRYWRWPNGCRSAFTVSSDVDSINVADFFKRFVNF